MPVEDVLVFWLRAPTELALIESGGGAVYLNSGERMLAGGRCVAGRPNSGEATVVVGDRLFGYFPPAESLLHGGGRQLR
jgi:hypothetical protein